MHKSFLILFLSVLLFACSNKNTTNKIDTELTDEEMAIAIYAEAVEALKLGDAYFAGVKFKEDTYLYCSEKEWENKFSNPMSREEALDFAKIGTTDQIITQYKNKYP